MSGTTFLPKNRKMENATHSTNQFVNLNEAPPCQFPTGLSNNFFKLTGTDGGKKIQLKSNGVISGLEAWNKQHVMTKPLTRGSPARSYSVHLTLWSYQSNIFQFGICVNCFSSMSASSCKSFYLYYCFKIHVIFSLMSPITLTFL